jgi:hypothetical protein
MPPLPEDPALADGLDVRRLFGEVRLRVGLLTEDPPNPPAAADDPMRELELMVSGATPSAAEPTRMERVEKAAKVLAWATQESCFGRVRVDEQVRFHLVKERIERWVAAGRDPSDAESVWSEVVKFCGYIAEINLRADLLEFDRRLVLWGLASIERKGVSKSTLKPLSWLFGRDGEFDLLLDRDDLPEAETLVAQLERLGASLGIG